MANWAGANHSAQRSKRPARARRRRPPGPSGPDALRRISAVREDRTVTRVSRGQQNPFPPAGPWNPSSLISPSPSRISLSSSSKPPANWSRKEARWRRRGTPRRHACSPKAEHAVVERPRGRCPDLRAAGASRRAKPRAGATFRRQRSKRLRQGDLGRYFLPPFCPVLADSWSEQRTVRIRVRVLGSIDFNPTLLISYT